PFSASSKCPAAKASLARDKSSSLVGSLLEQLMAVVANNGNTKNSDVRDLGATLRIAHLDIVQFIVIAFLTYRSYRTVGCKLLCAFDQQPANIALPTLAI